MTYTRGHRPQTKGCGIAGNLPGDTNSLFEALVGAIGLEPTTPTMSRWCSNQLSYAPEEAQILSEPFKNGKTLFQIASIAALPGRKPVPPKNRRLRCKNVNSVLICT
jgi:hypothetical protein